MKERSARHSVLDGIVQEVSRTRNKNEVIQLRDIQHGSIDRRGVRAKRMQKIALLLLLQNTKFIQNMNHNVGRNGGISTAVGRKNGQTQEELKRLNLAIQNLDPRSRWYLGNDDLIDPTHP